MNKNKGFGLIGLILSIAVIGFVGIYGFQVGITYINKNLISKAIHDTIVENTDKDGVTANQVKKEILEKLSLSDLDFSSNDIIVTKIGRKFNVEANYSKRIGISDSISIVLDFDISEDSK